MKRKGRGGKGAGAPHMTCLHDAPAISATTTTFGASVLYATLTSPKPDAPIIYFGMERRLCYKCIFSSDANLIHFQSRFFVFYQCIWYVPELSEAIRCCGDLRIHPSSYLFIYWVEPGSETTLRELVIVLALNISKLQSSSK